MTDGNTLLFYTDFTENDDRAFDIALELARKGSWKKIFLLHVIPEPDAQFWKTYLYEVDEIDAKAKNDIDEKFAVSYTARIPSHIEEIVVVRVGKSEDMILQCAKEFEADLIVMSREGKKISEKMVTGSLAEKIVRKAHCAVLVIPGE